MAPQHPPTRTRLRPADDVSSTTAPPEPGTRPSTGSHPVGSRAVWAGIAAALVAAVWLVVAGVVVDVDPAPSARANQAATNRLQGLADQYEAVRSTRANEAATARLQGLADRYAGR